MKKQTRENIERVYHQQRKRNITITVILCIILCIYTCKFYIWVRRDRIYSHKFVKYYNNAIIAGMWSVNLILFLNFIYGISYLYSVLKYGITIL